MNDTRQKIILTLRWASRLTGTLIAGTMLLIAVGEGFPPFFSLPWVDRFSFLSLLLMCCGLLGGWRWPFVGGVLTLLGVISFFALQQVLLLNLVFVPAVIVGILYIVIHLIKN